MADAKLSKSRAQLVTMLERFVRTAEVPIADVPVEGQGVHEHVAEIGASGDVPLPEVLVEGLGGGERGDAGCDGG